MGIRQQAKSQGKIRYNSGKLCKQGHNSDRLVSTGKCIKCKNEEDYERKRILKYGISQEEYFELFWKQNGTCAICREKETAINSSNNKVQALAVDHCHETGKIRGLLCRRCNQGIGLLKHSPSLIRIAALYCES